MVTPVRVSDASPPVARSEFGPLISTSRTGWEPSAARMMSGPPERLSVPETDNGKGASPWITTCPLLPIARRMASKRSGSGVVVPSAARTMIPSARLWVAPGCWIRAEGSPGSWADPTGSPHHEAQEPQRGGEQGSGQSDGQAEGREHGLGQRGGLVEAGGQLLAVHRAGLAVLLPGRTGEATADDALDGSISARRQSITRPARSGCCASGGQSRDRWRAGGCRAHRRGDRPRRPSWR